MVGATGSLGRAICRRLVHKGLSTRSLVRLTSDQAKVNYSESGYELMEVFERRQVVLSVGISLL